MLDREANSLHSESFQLIPRFEVAPPRKEIRAPGQGHPVHLRLPEDIFARIEAKAKAEGRPFRRIVINELAEQPYLAMQVKLSELIGTLETLMAKYTMRLEATGLNEDLVTIVDGMLAERADSMQLQARLDQLATTRRAMLELESQAVEMQRKQLGAHMRLLAEQIAAMDALPDGNPHKDVGAGRREQLERLRRTNPDLEAAGAKPPTG